MIWNILGNAAIGIAAGIIRGGVGYVKASQQAQEKFDTAKYMVTVGLYGLVGGACALLSVQLDVGIGIATSMAVGLLIEELAKAFTATSIYKAIAAKVGSI